MAAILPTSSSASVPKPRDLLAGAGTTAVAIACLFLSRGRTRISAIGGELPVRNGRVQSARSRDSRMLASPCASPLSPSIEGGRALAMAIRSPVEARHRHGGRGRWAPPTRPARVELHDAPRAIGACSGWRPSSGDAPAPGSRGFAMPPVAWGAAERGFRARSGLRQAAHAVRPSRSAASRPF